MTTPTTPPKPRKPISRPHRWIMFTLGRICSECDLVQALDEYDDSSACSGLR